MLGRAGASTTVSARMTIALGAYRVSVRVSMSCSLCAAVGREYESMTLPHGCQASLRRRRRHRKTTRWAWRCRSAAPMVAGLPVGGGVYLAELGAHIRPSCPPSSRQLPSSRWKAIRAALERAVKRATAAAAADGEAAANRLSLLHRSPAQSSCLLGGVGHKRRPVTRASCHRSGCSTRTTTARKRCRWRRCACSLRFATPLTDAAAPDEPPPRLGRLAPV